MGTYHQPPASCTAACPSGPGTALPCTHDGEAEGKAPPGTPSLGSPPLSAPSPHPAQAASGQARQEGWVLLLQPTRHKPSHSGGRFGH